MFVFVLPVGLLPFVFPFIFCGETLGPLPLIFMMVSPSSGLRIFWNANLLLHFIVLHHIFLNHYMAVLVLLSDDVRIILFYFD
jgi:hypothetical protein